MSVKGKAAIIGIGEVPTGVYPDRSVTEIAVRTSVEAIKDAGLDKNEIDAILVTGVISDMMKLEINMSCGKMVEELGLSHKCKVNFQVFSGGGSSGDMLQTAIGLLNLGVVQNVLCIHADKLGSGGTVEEVGKIFHDAANSFEWETPFGWTNVSINDYIMNRYMYETGVTMEQQASVVVSNRKWAALNPNAAIHTPITVEEIMASVKLTPCMHMGFFTQPSNNHDGGCAFIMTSGENAEKFAKPVYILGEGGYQSHCFLNHAPDVCNRGVYAAAAKDAFEMAGLTPKDMAFAQIYEALPVVQMVAFEELGFVEKGGAGPFFEAGHGAPGGTFPVTTNGGLLSMGHTGAGGGYALLVEAVRQLKGQAGERQIPDAVYGCYTCTGGAYGSAKVGVLGTRIP